jgi:Glycosyl transferase family 2
MSQSSDVVIRTLLIAQRDSHLNVTVGGDDGIPTVLANEWAFDPPTPSMFHARGITAIEIEVDKPCSEGGMLATLRLAAIALDLNPGATCRLQMRGSLDEQLQRCIRFVGLTYRVDDAAVFLDRPHCEAARKGLVSILIAGHNPRYLREALMSVEQQSYRSMEIVVCDDCPTDAVQQVVDAYARKSAIPVRYFRNARRLGVRRNYERCFENATGEFAKFLNDDDRLDPTCIKKMVSALNALPTAHLVSAHRRRIDERGFPMRDQPATTPIVRSSTYIDGTSLINALLMLGLNFVGEPSSAMFRRATGRVGDEPLIHFLDSMARGVADLVLWCKLSLRGDCIFLSERLTEFRIHAEQQTQATDVSTLALTAIPELRALWEKLEFVESFPPNVLRTLDLSAMIELLTQAEPPTQPWSATLLALFAPPGRLESQLIGDWRAKRHPYFDTLKRSA